MIVVTAITTKCQNCGETQCTKGEKIDVTAIISAATEAHQECDQQEKLPGVGR